MSNPIIGDGYRPELTGAKIDTIENQAVNEASRVAVEQVAADWDSIKQAEREKFVKSHENKLKDEDPTIFSVPRKGCKHCYGTGVEGAYTNESPRLPGQPCLCRCLTNRLIYHPWNPDPVRLTYGAFKQLMASARQRYNLKEQNNEQSSEVVPSAIQGTREEVDTKRDEGQASGDNNEAVGSNSVS